MESKALAIFPISLRTSILFNLLSYKRIISRFRCKCNKNSVKKKRRKKYSFYVIFDFSVLFWMIFCPKFAQSSGRGGESQTTQSIRYAFPKSLESVNRISAASTSVIIFAPTRWKKLRFSVINWLYRLPKEKSTYTLMGSTKHLLEMNLKLEKDIEKEPASSFYTVQILFLEAASHIPCKILILLDNFAESKRCWFLAAAFHWLGWPPSIENAKYDSSSENIHTFLDSQLT